MAGGVAERRGGGGGWGGGAPVAGAVAETGPAAVAAFGDVPSGGWRGACGGGASCGGALGSPACGCRMASD